MNKVFLLLSIITTMTITACGTKPGKGEPGYELLNSKCGKCHPTGVKKKYTTREDWEQAVNRMVSKGAAVNNDEKAVLVDFLVKYYHP